MTRKDRRFFIGALWSPIISCSGKKYQNLGSSERRDLQLRNCRLAVRPVRDKHLRPKYLRKAEDKRIPIWSAVGQHFSVSTFGSSSQRTPLKSKQGRCAR